MTAPELKRYAPNTVKNGLHLRAECQPFADGEYVRFADAKAYTQAAIAAAMMGAVVKSLEWWDSPYFSASHGESYHCIHRSDNFYEVRVGNEGDKSPSIDGTYASLESAKAAAQADYQARILSALSIPTDPMAALEAVKAEVRDEVLESPEIKALIDALAYMVNHAEWREQNDGVFWEATNLARAALAAIRAMKGGA